MIYPIINPFSEIAFARSALTRGRIQGPILPAVWLALQNCITNRNPLYFSYQGDGVTKAGKRWGEPYILGYSKFTGNALCLIYQYKGETISEVEGWATFRLDRFGLTAPLTSMQFKKPRPLYYGGEIDFSNILLSVSFPNE